MKLSQLRKSWIACSDREKLELIEETNERRIQAFEIKKKKKSKKRKSGGGKKRKSSTPKTPEGLMELMKNMSPEEKKNFQLMIQMNKK